MPLRQYRKRFLAYINKDDFNNVEGQINPMEYHSLFITWATLFSVIDYEKMSMWMYFSPICTAISAITAATICFISCVHYVQMCNIHLITESGAYLIMMVYQLLILFAAVRGKKYYHNLLRAMREDFLYICTKGQKYREKFFENQRLTFKACVIMIIVCATTGGGMILYAAIAVAITVIGQEDGAKRPPMFPFWLFDYDLHASPVYEIIFVASLWFTISYACVYAFMMQSNVIWIREITCKADMVTWNLEDLLIDIFPAKTKEEEKHYAAIIQHRMRTIIPIHHSMFKLMEDYAAVYKKCLFVEQKFIASPVICLTAYCFAEKYDKGEIQVLLLFLCLGTTIGAFFPNYLGTHLLEKIESVSDACYNVPFWNAGPILRPYLILIMQRSMRPLPIVAPGFAEVSLNTYSTIISRAYSCFHMLRQADLNFS